MEVVSLHAGDTLVEVVPERGGLVTRLAVAGREVLYLDRATLEDPSKNVRGGIPVLLPFAGRLEGDRFVPAGTTMKQHGFGRNLPWTVRARSGDALELVLEASDATRAQYPYDFSFDYGVQAGSRGLALSLTIRNRGKVPLPVAPGFHPYFCCPAARKPELASDLPGFDPARLSDQREFDFGLPAPASGRARFEVPELGWLALSMSPDFRHLQLWSQPGKPFVCLEPFSGPPGIINTAQRHEIPPGAAQRYAVRIDLA